MTFLELYDQLSEAPGFSFDANIDDLRLTGSDTQVRVEREENGYLRIVGETVNADASA